MEIITFLLVLIVAYLVYRITILNSHIIVGNVTHSMLVRTLIAKSIISKSELDTELNKIIGDLAEADGNKIIKHAKKIGVRVPEYMNEKELEEYLKS